MISDGTPKPYRLRARGPSFCNLSIFESISDMLIADLVATLGTLDLVMGEVDR